MTNQQHEKFQENIDSAFNALERLMRITLSDKDMNGTEAMAQYDMFDAFQTSLAEVSVRKHKIMEAKNI
tara:strand:+ start:76 stop:282 length:207 start_codon:yes stop_codon:yes gene_type:complete